MLSNCLECYKLRSCLKNINAEARRTVQILKNNHFLECFAVLYFSNISTTIWKYTSRHYIGYYASEEKKRRKKTVENSNIKYFRSRCFMNFFVLDDFETSNLESFNMYYHKGGSKESQNKNIMYMRSGLTKNWSILKLATM